MDVIERLCIEIEKPHLSVIYNGKETKEDLENFYLSLTSALNLISQEQDCKLPKDTNIYGLPDFVAQENCKEWIKALYHLGFRAGGLISSNSSACHIIHPDGRYIEYDYDELQTQINELHKQLLQMHFS